MEVVVDKSNMVRAVPKVGSLWAHPGQNAVYLRVEDTIGKALDGTNAEKSFYSIDIETGGLVYTPRNSNIGFVILHQVEPLKLRA